MESNANTMGHLNAHKDVDPVLSLETNDVYEDQNVGADLTKEDINRMAWRSLLLQASFNYERMQAAGWLYGLLPALKKIHTNPNDLSKSMKPYGLLQYPPVPCDLRDGHHPGDGAFKTER